MEKWFEVAALETERLLAEWRWLCPSRLSLVARNVFGELFLQDETMRGEDDELSPQKDDSRVLFHRTRKITAC
jgi:hypothetical protein